MAIGTSTNRTKFDSVLTDFAQTVGESGPVCVEGGRTRWTTGGTVDPSTRLVKAPAGIAEYVPDEMIVRVLAGTTVAELHSVLAARGQRTALPERSPASTVGGAFAVGENHVSMLGRGALRTSLLQVRYVSAEGRLVTGGGPTVKNVSGFDLPRLMVGSLGTLGLLAEVIVRTNPRPAVTQWFTVDGVDPFVLRDAVLQASAILWDGRRTWIELEGHQADVDAECVALGRLGSVTEAEGPPPLPAHRWSLAPADARRLDGTDTGPFVAVIGTGLVFADNAQPARSLSREVRAVSARLKANFDPTGRLNPGRDAGVK
jgi:glycolate oxidase FAD binding subunit